MQKIIIIKYGELTTKKDNIGLFLSALKQPIRMSFYGITGRYRIITRTTESLQG